MRRDIYNTIFQRDIILRGKIQSEQLFLQVARFVLEHIGSLVSINNIRKTLNQQGISISYEAVDNYVNLMVKSYFLYPCLRYDIKGKEILKTNHKYYVVDFGIRQQLVPNMERNTGRLLENFVYLELLKAGYEVYTGKVNRDQEIDFVATKEHRKIYIQVSETIIEPKTRERETSAFHYIKDNHKRYLLTLDTIRYESTEYEHQNVFDFIANL